MLTFPELVDGCACGLRANIEQNADYADYLLQLHRNCDPQTDLTIRLDERAKRVEEPPMTVELLLVLLLEAENDLDGARAVRGFTSLSHHDAGCVPTLRS